MENKQVDQIKSSKVHEQKKNTNHKTIIFGDQ